MPQPDGCGIETNLCDAGTDGCGIETNLCDAGTDGCGIETNLCGTATEDCGIATVVCGIATNDSALLPPEWSILLPFGVRHPAVRCRSAGSTGYFPPPRPRSGRGRIASVSESDVCSVSIGECRVSPSSGRSSVGRVGASQALGRGFESRRPLQSIQALSPG